MSTAQIKVTAPVYFAAGETLNGVALAAPQWVRSGAASVATEKAQALERDGYADILSVDGAPAVWPSCCSGGHDHA